MDGRVSTQTSLDWKVNTFSNICANWRAYINRYLWPLPRFKREVVIMVDGKLPHGGLTDRFRNILSIYSYCKTNGIPFKVYYNFPAPLTNYLVPNKYDWEIRSKDLSYHILSSQEIDLYVNELPLTGERKSSQARDYNNHIHLTTLDQELSKKRRRQYHIYGNAYFARGQYKSLFEELFKPSAYLAKRLEALRNSFSEPYESVTLRFQMLLGDLEEGTFEVLGTQQQEDLIETCIKKIDELWRGNSFSTPKILVTSDSSRFLSRISSKEYVYTIPGKMEHMDYTHNPDLEINAKPFLDLFLLMKSKRLTQLITGKMYQSGFPAFAAELGGHPYLEIVF